MDNCTRCIWSGTCSTEDNGENCDEFTAHQVQNSTCIQLVVATLAWDSDAMQESIQQLLSEIPAERHAALGDALVQLGGMVFREQYQDGIDGVRLYPSNKEIQKPARDALVEN